jgi:DNA mismatch repair protein MutS2
MTTTTFAELELRSLQHLEWERLHAEVRNLCRGDSARRRGLSLSTHRDDTRLRLARTAEVLAWLDAGEAPRLDGLHDLASHLERLERGGALDAPALVQLRSVLRTGRGLREFVARRRHVSPALDAACAFDPTLDELEQLLDGTLREDGSLEDHASADLAKLRIETANLRTRIVARLEGLIERHRDLLQDDFYTLREGRYVLPIRSDAHERFAGIVHGSSQSGASIFVEPHAIVEQGNRLKMAQAELEREEQRILAELSARAAARVPELGALCASIDLIDLHHACAMLAGRLQGSVPELRDEPVLLLHAARHPLLALDGVDVVPNDLALGPGEGLILSGPNAGGKSVLLKTLGLAALMARAGLPIAAAPGSVVGHFDAVLSQMGDDQSTTHNLSTFSAHIRHVAAIVEHAGPRTLVLLDEPAAGTDPQEGAALACALVDGLLQRGAALAATTHYEPLKALSLEDPRLRCAAVGLETDSMRPTFMLTLGLPGRSSALSVALRFGLPPAMIAHAERLIPEAARRFEGLLGELDRRLAEQRAVEASLARELACQSTLRRELEERMTQLKARGRTKVDDESAALVSELRLAREELSRQRAELKAQRLDEPQLRQQAQQVDRVAARIALGGDLTAPRDPQPAALEPMRPEALAPGALVHVPRLNAEALVVEPPQRGKLRVAIGAMKLWVDLDEVRPARPVVEERRAPLAPVRSPTDAQRNPDNTLNVRGLRVDDALRMMESFIDRMYGADLRVGYVVHGHGTGAMREAVRRHLTDALPHVERHAPASHADGGDAVTVFYLK